MRRGIEKPTTAFNEFLEDQADGSMLTDKKKVERLTAQNVLGGN